MRLKDRLRFTDFLVNEVSLDGTVLHLLDIKKPEEDASKKDKGKSRDSRAQQADLPSQHGTTIEGAEPEHVEEREDGLLDELRFEPHASWTSAKTFALRHHLSDAPIKALHDLFVDGRDPPPKQDQGWGQRKMHEPVIGEEELAMNLDGAAVDEVSAPSTQNNERGGGRGQGRDRGWGRGRGGRGGRGGKGGGAREEWWMANGDTREVLSQVSTEFFAVFSLRDTQLRALVQPITEKEKRTAAHKAIRELFDGAFETTSREVVDGEGHMLVIKWARQSSRRAPQERGRGHPVYLCCVVSMLTHSGGLQASGYPHISISHSTNPIAKHKIASPTLLGH